MAYNFQGGNQSMAMKFYYFERQADGANPAGVTVSKTEALPDGDFKLDEYCWPGAALWFITNQAFTCDERQEAYLGLLHSPEMLKLAAWKLIP
jgi:hypothetical protein